MKIEQTSSRYPTEIKVASPDSQAATHSAAQQPSNTPRILNLTAPLPMTDDAPAFRRVLASDVSEVAQALQRHLHEKCQSAEAQLHKSWHLPGSEKSQLHAYISASQTLTEHGIALLEKYSNEDGLGRIDPKTILSIEDAAKISRAFEVIAERLPQGETRELSGLLGLHLKAAWSQMKADELKPSLLKKLAPYRNPETSASDTVFAALGLEAGLPGIKAGKFKIKPLALSIRQALGMGKKAELAVNPEGAVYLNNHTIRKAQTTVEAGVEVPVITGAKFSGKVRTVRHDVKLKRFETVDDLVERQGHSQRWSYANRNEYEGILKTGKWHNTRKQIIEAIRHLRAPSSSELSDLKTDQQNIVNNRQRLNELLNRVLGLEHVNVSAPPSDRNVGMAGRSTIITASVEGSAKAELGGLVKGAVDLTYTRKAYDFHVYGNLSFTEVILQHPERLSELPAQLIKHASDSLAHTSDRSPERQQAATEKLQDLEGDLQHYYTVVKELDGLRYRERAGLTLNPKTKKRLKDEKHRLENKWHAIGRHNLLQILSASHALLTFNATPPDMPHSDAARQLVKNTAELLAKPDIRYDKQRLSDAVHFKLSETQQDHSDTVTANASLSFLGQSGTLSVSQERLSRIHANRMRQGDYVNNTLSVKGTVDPFAATVAATALAEKLGRSVSLPDGASHVLHDGIVGGDASETRTHLVRTFSPEYTSFPEFEGDKDLKTRFTRNTRTNAQNVRLNGAGPVAPGINLSAELKYEHAKTHMINQTLGTDNLSYVLLILNRKLSNKAFVPDDMNKFYETHKIEFSTIFKQLGDPESSVSREARFFLNELIEQAPESEQIRAHHSLETVFNGSGRHSQQTQAKDALNVLTNQNSNADEKTRARDYLNSAIHSLPWKRVKEPVPPSSVLSTLGVGKGHYNIEKPTSKLEKAEQALEQLTQAATNSVTGAKPNRQVQHAVQTLTRLFNGLNAESDYDHARKTLSLLIEKFADSESGSSAKTALNNLVKSNESVFWDLKHLDADRQKDRQVLAQFIEQQAASVGDKAVMRYFADQFRQTMARYRADPSKENLNRSKDIFFEFQQYQAKPSGAAKKAVFEEATYAKWQSKSAFNTGTHLLLSTGLHPRRTRSSFSAPQQNRQMPDSSSTENKNKNTNKNTTQISNTESQNSANTTPETDQRPRRTTLGDLLRIPLDSDQQNTQTPESNSAANRNGNDRQVTNAETRISANTTPETDHRLRRTTLRDLFRVPLHK